MDQNQETEEESSLREGFEIQKRKTIKNRLSILCMAGSIITIIVSLYLFIIYEIRDIILILIMIIGLLSMCYFSLTKPEGAKQSEII